MIILSLPLCLCPRYFNTWQHKDNIIAYYVGATSVGEKRRYCASIQYGDRDYVQLVSVKCFQSHTAHYLCEVHPVVSDHVANTASRVTVSENIPFPAKPNFTRSILQRKFKVTSCPDGHVTHEMFACDAASACWVDAATTSRSCRSSLQPLPPSFACTTGQDDVPYTLVCDHRPDCKDSSDESFCDFPRCDPYKHFECGSREVRSPVVFMGLCHSVCPSAFLLACLPGSVSVCLSVCLSSWVSVSLFVRLSAYSLVFLGLCQCACLSACMSTVHLPVQLSVRLFVCLSMSLLACFPVYIPSACLRVCLSERLSSCLLGGHLVCPNVSFVVTLSVLMSPLWSPCLS